MKTLIALCLSVVPLAAAAGDAPEIQITDIATGNLVKAPTVKDPKQNTCLSVKADAVLDLSQTASVESGKPVYGKRTDCPRFLVDVKPAPKDEGNHNIMVNLEAQYAGGTITKRECTKTKLEFYVVSRNQKGGEATLVGGTSTSAVWRNGKCGVNMSAANLSWDKNYRVAYSVKVGAQFRKVMVKGSQWGNPP